jgi:hypothetical protein
VSFILDALRKSESERRREATPGLAHLPPAAPRSHAPSWVWVVMSVLIVGLLGLAALWWQSTQTPPRGPLEVEGLALETPRPVVPVSGASAEPRALSTPGVSGGPADPVQAESRADSGLPTAAEVRASGIALPELNLQLISYSEDATRRFVFINGFRYGQGQRVQNGPRIVSIYADSVVLEQQGRDFVLTPQ